MRLFLLLVVLLAASQADAACGSGATLEAQYKEAPAASIVRVVSMKLERRPHFYTNEDGSPGHEGSIAVVVAEAELVEHFKGDRQEVVSIITPAEGHKCHSPIEVGGRYVVFPRGLWPVVFPDGALVPLEEISPDVLSRWRNGP